MDGTSNSELELLRSATAGLAAEARDRALEFEDAKQLPDDFIAKLKAAGVYRLLVARSQGGLGGSTRDWLDLIIALAESDGSTGWACAHGAICSALLANVANQAFVAEAMADPDMSIAWSNLPRVKSAEYVTGGMQISGEWAFATGCTAATFMGGMFVKPGTENTNKPVRIVALARRGDAKIKRTWDPGGLAATGSHSVVFDDLFIPDHQIFEWPEVTITSGLDTGIFATGTWLITMCAAATHLGIARRALDEARARMVHSSGASTGLGDASNSEAIRMLERAEGILLSCRLALYVTTDAVWDARKDLPKMPTQAIRDASLVGVSTVHQCSDVVRMAYAQGGAASIARTNALQKSLRDSSCLSHHVAANATFLEALGRIRIGMDGLGYQIG